MLSPPPPKKKSSSVVCLPAFTDRLQNRPRLHVWILGHSLVHSTLPMSLSNVMLTKISRLSTNLFEASCACNVGHLKSTHADKMSSSETKVNDLKKRSGKVTGNDICQTGSVPCHYYKSKSMLKHQKHLTSDAQEKPKLPMSNCASGRWLQAREVGADARLLCTSRQYLKLVSGIQGSRVISIVPLWWLLTSGDIFDYWPGFQLLPRRVSFRLLVTWRQTFCATDCCRARTAASLTAVDSQESHRCPNYISTKTETEMLTSLLGSHTGAKSGPDAGCPVPSPSPLTCRKSLTSDYMSDS